MEPADREGQRGLEVVGELAVVAGDEHVGARRFREPRRTRSLVGEAQRSPCSLLEVEHERRLVDLHPACAGRDEAAQQLGVDRQQTVQLLDELDGLAACLGEEQERDRAEQHRPRLESEASRLTVFVHRFGRCEGELLAARELRNEVVVVSVEPLRELERGQLLVAAGEGEVGVEIDVAAGPAVARGDSADHHRRVEDVVVERDVVARESCETQAHVLRRAQAAARRPLGALEQRPSASRTFPAQCDSSAHARSAAARSSGSRATRRSCSHRSLGLLRPVPHVRVAAFSDLRALLTASSSVGGPIAGPQSDGTFRVGRSSGSGSSSRAPSQAAPATVRTSAPLVTSTAARQPRTSTGFPLRRPPTADVDRLVCAGRATGRPHIPLRWRRRRSSTLLLRPTRPAPALQPAPLPEPWPSRCWRPRGYGGSRSS